MRYKEFNTNKVLENCISLFWKNGFGSCSINDIVKQTNVNRFSLYNEFQNKEGILTSALSLYHNRYSRERIAILKQNTSIKEVLTAFFSSYLMETETCPPGCFMIHISTELADTDNRIKTQLNNYLQDIEREITSLLIRFNKSDTDAKPMAMRLTGLFCNSMCFCVIQTPKERDSYINMGIDLILNKIEQDGTHA